MVIFLAKDSHK